MLTRSIINRAYRPGLRCPVSGDRLNSAAEIAFVGVSVARRDFVRDNDVHAFPVSRAGLSLLPCFEKTDQRVRSSSDFTIGISGFVDSRPALCPAGASSVPDELLTTTRLAREWERYPGILCAMSGLPIADPVSVGVVLALAEGEDRGRVIVRTVLVSVDSLPALRLPGALEAIEDRVFADPAQFHPRFYFGIGRVAKVPAVCHAGGVPCH